MTGATSTGRGLPSALAFDLLAIGPRRQTVQRPPPTYPLNYAKLHSDAPLPRVGNADASFGGISCAIC